MSTFKQSMMKQKQTSDDYLAFTAEEAGSTISMKYNNWSSETNET